MLEIPNDTYFDCYYLSPLLIHSKQKCELLTNNSGNILEYILEAK